MLFEVLSISHLDFFYVLALQFEENSIMDYSHSFILWDIIVCLSCFKSRVFHETLLNLFYYRFKKRGQLMPLLDTVFGWTGRTIIILKKSHKNLIIAHSKPTHTSCGTPQRECTYSVPIYSTCQKTFPVGLFRSVVSLFLLVGSFPFYCRYVLVRSGSFIRNILFCVEVSWSTANQSRCNFLTYLCGASHSART